MGCIDFERAAVLLFQRCGNHSANPFLLRPSTFDAGLWHSCLRFSSSKRWSLFSLVSVRLFRTGSVQFFYPSDVHSCNVNRKNVHFVL
ncbi:hypothetical protein T12_9797 [Trichinella patagoniensis]|uniref:Uncharacterized protein n=1 Tax=Trichinella patagoniensis TaxID=990121 RepID=A0A0V1A1N6_9BILA|nr:hypothetical protein T12_9797 [Trichinella patagoniensis]